MKNKKKSYPILLITEKIMKQSGCDKLNEIKKSLQIRSSKTRRKSSDNLNSSKKRKLSSSRRVQNSSQPLTQKKKRSQSKKQNYRKSSYSKFDESKRQLQKTKKRFVTFSVNNQQNSHTFNTFENIKSPLKPNNQQNKQILKQLSSLKKCHTPQRNSQRKSVLTNSKLGYEQSLTSTKFNADNIVSRKLFGQQRRQRVLVQNQISFNLNLNKILQRVYKIIEQQRSSKQNMNVGVKKESILSMENMRLIKRINRCISNNDEQIDLKVDFKKRKNQIEQNKMVNSNMSRMVNNNNRSRNDRVINNDNKCKYVDYIQQRHESDNNEYNKSGYNEYNKSNNNGYNKSAQLSRGRIYRQQQQKQTQLKPQSKQLIIPRQQLNKSQYKQISKQQKSKQISKQQQLKQIHKQFQLKQQLNNNKYQSNISNNNNKQQGNNKRYEQLQQQIKILRQQNNNKKIQYEYKIKQINIDKNWLVSTIQQLLNQNQSLKSILTH